MTFHFRNEVLVKQRKPANAGFFIAIGFYTCGAKTAVFRKYLPENAVFAPQVLGADHAIA